MAEATKNNIEETPTKRGVRPKPLQLNGSAVSPLDDDGPPSPSSPKYKTHSNLPSPNRSPSPSFRRSRSKSRSLTPSPSREQQSPEIEDLPKGKSVSFHSHTNWKNERKIQSSK